MGVQGAGYKWCRVEDSWAEDTNLNKSDLINLWTNLIGFQFSSEVVHRGGGHVGDHVHAEGGLAHYRAGHLG